MSDKIGYAHYRAEEMARMLPMGLSPRQMGSAILTALVIAGGIYAAQWFFIMPGLNAETAARNAYMRDCVPRLSETRCNELWRWR